MSLREGEISVLMNLVRVQVYVFAIFALPLPDVCRVSCVCQVFLLCLQFLLISTES